MKPYDCHSKPRADGYWASDGKDVRKVGEKQALDRITKAVWIPDTMTKECQYRKTTPDERCKGCNCP